MTKKVRWGFLSTARINGKVLPPVHRSPSCEAAAVASRDLGRAQKFAADWKIPTAYGSYEALLADPTIDVIYNPLPNHLHMEWTVKALEAGKHVLCEKPLALTMAEVDAIIAAVKRTGRFAAEAFMYRHHPQTLRVKELVNAGEIGELVLMNGSFTFFNEDPGDIRLVKAMGGGSLWDVGCYPVTYANLIAGGAPVAYKAQQVVTSDGTDLSFTGLMRYENGALAHVDSSFTVPYQTRFEIKGTRGTILIPRPFSPQGWTKIHILKDEQERMERFYAADLYRGEVEDMNAVARSEKTPFLTLEESRANIGTLTALYAAAEK